ncbi:hypothetical protein [Clostridium sp. CF012]|uniref:hypothetical protein n=1 Tax=Clostridium sp. CF012 TaxID=2843319 RepID=UPI001C0BA47C|nr:hypothetical protein [Clostridium sp. CF012]MBU3142553.1 hypothetical protein [Clostridium sp. CF012]
MGKKRPLGITLIGYFYIFGAIVLIITLFTNATEKYGIAVRVGLPNVPERLMKVLVSIIFLIIAYGYLKLKKWGWWLMIAYTIYLLVVSIILSNQYKQQLFYGNAQWSIIVLIYTLYKRSYFNKSQITTNHI